MLQNLANGVKFGNKEVLLFLSRSLMISRPVVILLTTKKKKKKKSGVYGRFESIRDGARRKSEIRTSISSLTSSKKNPTRRSCSIGLMKSRRLTAKVRQILTLVIFFRFYIIIRIAAASNPTMAIAGAGDGR